MQHNISTPRPWWFWAITIAFLLWSFVGCGMYLAERLMAPDAYVENFGEAMAGLREITPIWATAGYAIGVWFGLAGVIMLMARKKIAVPLFFASLIGAIVGFMPYFYDGRFKAVLTGADYGFMVFIFAECLFILWFARKMLSPANIPPNGQHFS